MAGDLGEDLAAEAVGFADQVSQGGERRLPVRAVEDVDDAVTALFGATLEALGRAERLALANKEALVMAGHLVMQKAEETGTEIIPVDSEHSAIFQALKSGSKKEVRKIVITASGGPFRNSSAGELKKVTPEQAMKHPNWRMGSKITVDSATLMNKALEVIEAHWLFHLTAEQIEVVVHPESIIHSMVEFCDGSVIAQMSLPDMRIPIQYALTYPERTNGQVPKLDLRKLGKLTFRKPDAKKFPALGLGFEAIRKGGTFGAVLNAANEVAVKYFIQKKIKFTDIYKAVKSVLDKHRLGAGMVIDEILAADGWARKETQSWLTSAR